MSGRRLKKRDGWWGGQIAWCFTPSQPYGYIRARVRVCVGGRVGGGGENLVDKCRNRRRDGLSEGETRGRFLVSRPQDPLCQGTTSH